MSEYTQSLDHTVLQRQMLGQYSELQEFAQEYAARVRKPKPLGIEEAKRRKSKLWSKCNLFLSV